MLSSVLRSDTAIGASIKIIDSLVEMRHFIASNAAMFEQVRGVDLELPERQRATGAWSVKKTPRRGVFSDRARAA